ncbi:glycosyltransferase family 10 domain-containing protein [Halomicronema hongdechloris]|uniref:glycosyltransferase family 10 domain-containing protein n=1 Tax=Halomicronema hongdechloris TaxID=1209493 RepID=UPI001650DC1F|nr:glycosyltransferase family 10 [Halomicronema hongdechloris]
MPLRYTPFTNANGYAFFQANGIAFSSPDDADLIVSGTVKKLLTFMVRFGRKKHYLLWTIEPRFSQHFQAQIAYPLLPPVHVMNVYTGIFDNNYFFAPQQVIAPDMTQALAGRKMSTAALMTYRKGRQWRLIHRGRDLDLCNLRTDIALHGYRRGCLDIYGKGWPEVVTVGPSTSKGRQQNKMAILRQYRFNLCFENTRWSYYCTEKIWDAIAAGCLPIYDGQGTQIYEDFPAHSFLDYSTFETPAALFDYLDTMTDDEFQVRLCRCVQAYNRAVQGRQRTQPRQAILQKTLQRINSILQHGGSHRAPDLALRQ